MSANFRAQIDIAALAKGTPDVRTLRQELEKLAAAADKAAQPKKVGLDLSAFANQLRSVTPGISSLVTSLNGLTSAFTGQSAAARVAGQAQVASLQAIQAQMQRYIQLANQASAASAGIRVPAASAGSMGGGGVGIGVAATGMAAYGGAKSLVNTGMEIQGVKATLTAANDNDPKKAAADYEYLVQQATKWGAGLKAVGTEFSNIKIAAELAGKAQGFSADHTETVAKGLFESLLKFKTAMGKSDADVKLVTKAFTDMLSKGTVASEELKKQLGNHMPGALAMGAKAVGLTTSELMDKLKSGSIQAYQFVALMTDQINAKYGAAAEKHSKDMQASLGRVSITWDLLKNSVGEGGLFEGVAKSANELATYMASPEAKAGAREMGLAVKDLATSIIDGTKAAAAFYKEHKGGIDTVAQFASILVGMNLALKAFGLLVLAPIGGIAKLAAGLGGVATTVGGMGASFAAAGAGAGAFGAAMATLGRSLMAAGGPYAALFAVANLIKQISDGRDFQKLGQRINSYQEGLIGDPEKLKGRIADIKKAIAEDEGSFAANGARALAPGGAADQRLSGLKTELAQYEKLLAASDALAAKKAKEDAKPKTTVDSKEMLAGVFGAGKNKDAGAGESRLGGAEAQAAKAELKRVTAEINQQLASNTIGYDKYVEDMKQAYANELNAQVAALDKQLANVKDPARREAIKQERIQALLDGYLAEVTTLETQTEEKRKKLVSDSLSIQSELAKATGQTAAASMADIERKYADVRARMIANNYKAGIEALNKFINVEYAMGRIDELNQALANSKTTADIKAAELQLKIADGTISAADAEAQALAIKKEMAQVNLVLAEQELAMALTDKDKLAALEKMAAAKGVLADKTSQQKAIEQELGDGLAQIAVTATTDYKNLGKTIEGVFKSLLNSLNKMMADQLSKSVMQMMNQGQSGGGGLLGGLLGAVASGIGGMFTAGGSTPTASYTPPADLQAFNSTAIQGVGGQSYTNGISSGVQNIFMNVSTPDANSFNNSQSQLIRDMKIGASGV